MKEEQDIFKHGSTTYYFSSKFFPKNIRSDVFRLYSFVRVADDYVDQVPADKKGFKDLIDQYKYIHKLQKVPAVLQSDTINKRVAKNMAALSKVYSFKEKWVQAFIDAMRSDLKKNTYKTIDDTLGYVYGSAEVIGLMMARIMGLPKEAEEAAKMQGRAMQWINFVRDIKEDNELGRCYFPQQELKKFGLKDLSKESAEKDQEAFRDFIVFQVARYIEWQDEAAKGFEYIPKRLRIPLKTAVDMYNWTAQEIAKDPMVVFDQKVKPRRKKVLKRALRNIANA